MPYPAREANTESSGAAPLGHPLVGRVLAQTYQVLGVIDAGGMGTVLAAEHLRLRRQVAVKVMSGEAVVGAHALTSFLREASILSELRHPNIVSILDHDLTEDGQPFLVMERLFGRSLAAQLRVEGRIAPRGCALIVEEVAAALAAAHEAGVVHCDLKPANVFLTEVPGLGTFVKLLDFGIARHTNAVPGPGAALPDFEGTPLYMSPEQARGKVAEVGPHTDQYALAGLAFEMLTGHVPFCADNLIELMHRIVRAPVPSTWPALSAPKADRVDAVLARAMAKSPAERYPDVLSFAAELTNSLDPWTLSSPPPSSTRHRISNDGTPPDGHDDDEEALIASLGGLGGQLHARRAPSTEDCMMSPEVAFVASRLEGELTVEQALEICPLPRLVALRALDVLVRADLVEMVPQTLVRLHEVVVA